MTLSPQQFQQLPMFMSGREIKEQVTPGDFGSTPAEQEAGYAQKLANVRGSGLEKSIRREGVVFPVHMVWDNNLSSAMLSNGHHRVAVSSEADPDRLIPVEHSEFDNANRYGRRTDGTRVPVKRALRVADTGYRGY